METKKRNIYFGKTFDCAINYQDHLIKIIVDEKDNMVNDPSIADIIIFSGTCACTQRQILTTVKSMINDLQKVKNRDNVTVYLTGCLTRPFRLSNDFFDNVTGWINENIDFVIPQNTPYHLLDLLYPHSEFEKWKNLFKKMCKAIDKVLGRDKPKERLEDYEDIADAINYGYYSKNNDKDKDDYEIGM